MSIDIRKALKKMLPHLIKGKQEGLNEADTVRLLTRVLETVLGFDAFNEITREHNIKNKYVDVAVKLDGKVRFLVEVKSAGTILRDRHIEQAQQYASQGNIRWVVLTNGVTWKLYHLTFDEGIDYELGFELDLETEPIKKSSELLSVLHRQSILKGELQNFWEKRSALSPESIGKVLFHEDILRLLRRNLRKQSGLLMDEEDLGRAIQNMLSPETRELLGPFKIYRRRKPRKGKGELTESVPREAPIEVGENSERPPTAQV